MSNELRNNEFLQTFIKHNDYSTEIIIKSDVDCSIEAAETKAFLEQWRGLTSFCGLNANETREKDANGTNFKKRQIFLQLLSLIQMSTPSHISWWTMIQSVDNFGWGVLATASDINCFWDNSVSSATHYDRLTKLQRT